MAGAAASFDPIIDARHFGREGNDSSTARHGLASGAHLSPPGDQPQSPGGEFPWDVKETTQIGNSGLWKHSEIWAK
jgi:hypothetical protein